MLASSGISRWAQRRAQSIRERLGTALQIPTFEFARGELPRLRVGDGVARTAVRFMRMEGPHFEVRANVVAQTLDFQSVTATPAYAGQFFRIEPPADDSHDTAMPSAVQWSQLGRTGS